MLRVAAALSVLGVVWANCQPMEAAPPQKAKPPAYLTPEEAGAEYYLQGEYRGWQRSLGSDRSSESIGLQVIALGNGEFAASKYYGGLPGSGWYGGERFEYVGGLAGDIVRLVGPDYTIELDGEDAAIFAADGRRAGELKKVMRTSPTLAAVPPEGALVLFDGQPTEKFVSPRITAEGFLEAGTQTKEAYGDFRLHVEFMLPFKPLGRGQDRGNSGVYLQGRYEVQVLDSFGLEGVENEAGALYRTRRPDVNMCFPPLTWQTYDIDFSMPTFDAAGNKTADARLSVWHNGIPIHSNVAIPNKTGGGSQEALEPLPTKLQDHGNPVLFRNIWLLPKGPNERVSSGWVKLPLHGPPQPIQQAQPVLPVWPVRVNAAGYITLGPVCP